MCEVCDAKNDIAVRRIEMDLGEHFSLASTSERITWFDITTRDMGTPIFINAVATYHISIHEATTYHDDAERKAAMIAAQNDFEQTCTELADNMAAGEQSFGADNNWDHWGSHWTDPGGNFVYPRTGNPWRAWVDQPEQGHQTREGTQIQNNQWATEGPQVWTGSSSQCEPTGWPSVPKPMVGLAPDETYWTKPATDISPPLWAMAPSRDGGC